MEWDKQKAAVFSWGSCHFPGQDLRPRAAGWAAKATSQQAPGLGGPTAGRTVSPRHATGGEPALTTRSLAATESKPGLTPEGRSRSFPHTQTADRGGGSPFGTLGSSGGPC